MELKITSNKYFTAEICLLIIAAIRGVQSTFACKVGFNDRKRTLSTPFMSTPFYKLKKDKTLLSKLKSNPRERERERERA